MSVQHHIRLDPDDLEGNGGIGRYVFLPGDLSRSALIAEEFEEVEVKDNPRGFRAHLGRLAAGDGEPVDVLAK